MTVNYGFPFPSLGDVPNVPDDVQSLADAVDAEHTQALGATPRRIDFGVNQANGSGEVVLTWPQDTWATSPVIVATPVEITGASVRVRGGGTLTQATIRVDDNNGEPVANAYVFWLAIGSRGTAGYPS